MLVTGADGFIGRHLVPFLAAQGYGVIAASRATTTFDNPNIAAAPLPDLSKMFDWLPLLDQCDAVVHLAGIAHKYAGDALYDRINHRATSALARAISRDGTKHLVFISSIAAQSGAFADHDLTEDDFPTPSNAYGRSKFAGEQAIRAAAISFTILRPVVIYGEGEKGNFATVHRLSRLPIPLPLGSLTAQRSILSIQNFNLAVETALSNPRALGRDLYRVGPETGHGRKSHRASPRRPRQITQLDIPARKLDRGGSQGGGPGFDLGTNWPAIGSSANESCCDRLATILSELRPWQPTCRHRTWASRFHSWKSSEMPGSFLA